ncbi:hypothetical protein AVB85_13820 [Salmonella enterica subsp. enterica serovar Vitkin]|uniref:Uncharacterized protein n=1 Tax=Salmonella enterica TaxID=28901 RepID=A0A748FHE5_SALER|nr:hypothetical protein [Salmonella enterica subsp. enterica serovar Abony]EAC0555082.1 hypothetical protein [Salmonella enterica subsp. enterica serovar Richmond]EAR6709944.1 hypothetical protein [Salmonella enterica]EBV3644431.1 hypothetical protein [Salmonella enterica subsp. enterica serovar Kottbus]ECY5310164.1 hypothetical protein [Salmonella enterica subsp. enterica serovar Vitkin]ECZ9689964.1 hypothetical protein [Salmonella enterica subsp. enterica serovar Potsdam]EDG9409586.1 hypoth
MIYITSKRDGFWRCGIAHSETTTAYPDDRFTPDELARLEAEPMLIVSRDAPGDAGAGPQIQALKSALQKTEADVDHLSGQVLTLQKQVSELTEELTATQDDRDSLAAQLADMTKERDALKAATRAPTKGNKPAAKE